MIIVNSVFPSSWKARLQTLFKRGTQPKMDIGGFVNHALKISKTFFSGRLNSLADIRVEADAVKRRTGFRYHGAGAAAHARHWAPQE